MQSRISNDQKKTPPPKRGEWDGGGAGKRLLMIPGKLLVRLGLRQSDSSRSGCRGHQDLCPGISFLGQLAPRFNYRIRIERHRLNAGLHQPLREIEMIGWTLSADTNVFIQTVAGRDGHLQQSLDCGVAFIETIRHQAGIPIQAQRQLREVVGADGETVEVLQDLFGQ